MTFLQRGFRKAVRTIERWSYERDRRNRQQMLEKSLPIVVYRGKQIAMARKMHRSCKGLIEANQSEMLSELRSDVAADQCAAIAERDAREAVENG